MLKKAAKRNREFIAAFAQHAAFWPGLACAEARIPQGADAYMCDIGVGKFSAPPTHQTSVEAADRWTELASMLVRQIFYYRTILDRRQNGMTWQDPIWNKAEQNARITGAKLYQDVLTLPLEADGRTLSLNPKTQRMWWPIAKRMLTHGSRIQKRPLMILVA